MRVGAVIVYVAVLVGVVVMADAGISKAYFVWEAASFCVDGSRVIRPRCSCPSSQFRSRADPDRWTGGDPLLLWSEVLLAAPIQAALVFAGLGWRGPFERFRASRASGFVLRFVPYFVLR